MSWLITYPQAAIPEDLATRLDQSANIIYCPLRFLEPLPIDTHRRDEILVCDRLIITSNFALHVFLSDFAKAWSGVHPHGTLLVLSQSMRHKVHAALPCASFHILVPESENRASLLRLLGSMPGAPAVLLCGDIALQGTPLPQEVRTIAIYTNQWSADHERQAAKTITEKTVECGAITAILVTSPSAYQRLGRLRKSLPDCFAARPTLYALGPSTAKAARQQGEYAKTPVNRKQVLRETIQLMLNQ